MIHLPPLPYEKDALSPHISERTVSFHYEKHHQGYVTNLNNLIENTSYAEKDLKDIILDSHQNASDISIFNNAAQVWNHTFYWHSMTPNPIELKDGSLKTAIENAFGSIDEFKVALKQAALGQFGSGWAWLVLTKDGTLAIHKTGNAQTPITEGLTPLLTVDVWEHAYYLDFQNQRAAYLEAFCTYLINWSFAEANLEKATI